MTQGYSRSVHRRGLRQDIVVQALRLLQGNEAQFSREASLSDAQYTSLTRDLLLAAESEVLGFGAKAVQPPAVEGHPPHSYLPRYVNASVFRELMGIGRLDHKQIEALVQARLEVSAGAADGK
jgi:hypothetical protein